MAAVRLLTPEKMTAQVYNSRQHLRHPIPLSLEVIPIGKTITEHEWEKFCNHLNAKEKQVCDRKKNGTVLFIGEGGLDALKHFQTKFNSRFHYRMVCRSKPWAKDGLTLAAEKGITIQELHYRNPHNGMTMLNEQDTLKLQIAYESARDSAQ